MRWALLAVDWAAIFAVGALIVTGFGGSMTTGVLTVLLLLLLMVATVPVGVSMIVSASLGLYSLRGARAIAVSLQSVTYDAVASWSLTVLPLFVLLGVALWRGGVAAKAYRAANLWFGRLPGGLAIGTTFAGAALASASGSTMGISMALGKMALPEMIRAGYSPKIATGSVAVVGTLGQIIPPSILLVLYAGVAETPVGPQLVAGVLPGVILALGFAAVSFGWAVLRPSDAPRGIERVSIRRKIAALPGLVPLALVALVVVGGLTMGLVTATEAGAVGALVALVVGWLSLGRGRRGPRLTLRYLASTSMEAVVGVATIFLMLIGAQLLNRVVALSGLSQELANWIVGLNLGRVGILLLLIVVYIVLGMFLESLPMILLTVPLLQGPLQALGVDPIWFGVFVIIMCEIGMVFPPVGLLTFIVHRLAQDSRVNLGNEIRLSTVFTGIMPYVAMTIAVAVLLIFVPSIVGGA